MFKILLYCTIKKEHLLKTPYAVDMDDCQPCLCCHFFTKVLGVDVGHPASAQNQKAFSNYISTIRSTLSLNSISLILSPTLLSSSLLCLGPGLIYYIPLPLLHLFPSFHPL